MAADLSGRAALITGAASGIGRASALAFAAAGANVALVDIDAGGLAETAAAARALGAPAEAIQADAQGGNGECQRSRPAERGGGGDAGDRHGQRGRHDADRNRRRLEEVKLAA